MEHGHWGNPLPELNLTGLNCRKRTKNLGSVLQYLIQNNKYHFFQGILLLTINYLVYAGIVLGRYRFPSKSILYFVEYGNFTLDPPSHGYYALGRAQTFRNLKFLHK